MTQIQQQHCAHVGLSGCSRYYLGPAEQTHREPHKLTQAVETEGAIVEEEADVACSH